MKHDYNIYKRLSDYESLVFAANCTRSSTSSKRSMRKFDKDLEKHLTDMYFRLFFKVYSPGPYKTFIIKGPKERIIETMGMYDRIVQRSIYREIYPIFERDCIKTSYACQVGKGCQKASLDVLNAMRKVSSRNKDKPIWIIKADIKSFFASIDRDILAKILWKKFKDKDLYILLTKFLGNSRKDKGIPIGNLLSQVFANFYLSRLDHYLKDQLGIKYYFRYMDDFV